MLLNQTTETYTSDSPDWLASRHGVGERRSVTLDKSLFTANTHYPNGYFFSGIPLGRVTSGGKYGPFDSTASDGRQVLAGFLFAWVDAGTGDVDPVGAMLDHCKVVAAKLPIAVNSTGVTSAAGRILFY
ncbi:MAG: head decoration protein [Pseudonocardiaceae bacterium]|nr:MAG: head decoration protein [Pseudonocardiaceae bacterium]